MTTEQKEFWQGEFGTSYISRNESPELHASNLNFFSNIFSTVEYSPLSFIEFGANIGMNARALKALYPRSSYTGVEINQAAYSQLKSVADEAHLCSIEDFQVEKQFDISFTKGVLIHLNPQHLELVYQKLYDSSSKFILVAEYYNREPVAINYRGYENKLFKRDFAGEILNRFKDLKLASYGFNYHRAAFPQDDISWFLMEKL